jgi:anti-sigma-K factor RskA
VTAPDPLAYLLGELDARQVADFESAMAADARLRADVERLRPIVGSLEALPAEAWRPEPPPPLAPLPGAQAPAPRAPRRLVLRPAVAFACSVALLAGGLGLGALVAGGGEGAPAGRTVALAPLEGGSDAAGTVELAGGGEQPMRLRVSGLTAAREGAFYEAWLLGEDGELVALGSFQVDAAGAATLDLPVPVDPERFSFFDVSLEPGDGDPAHSGDSVLRGSTAS